MSKKNTREIELAFSKSRDPDWEADVEIYGKRVLKTVRGICLGDEWTEIDSLKNKDWIELSDIILTIIIPISIITHNMFYWINSL